MNRMAIAGAFAGRLAGLVRERLDGSWETVIASEADVAGGMADIDVLVSLAFTPAMAAGARRLKLVQVPGAGLDRIDRAALPAGCVLANAYGHENGIAEHIVGAMLALTRDFARLDAELRQGRWSGVWSPGAPTPPPAAELAGRTLGILGYGRIGRRLARLAQAFDMEVCALRRNPAEPQDGVAMLAGPQGLETLLRRSDYLAITVTLDEATRGMIDASALAAMKPTAFLINVARGDVVDEAALFDALSERRIAGAALDVWFRYPVDISPTLPSALPFHTLPNVLMTPHVSGWTDGMLRERADVIAGNAMRVMRGETPVNLVPT